jgi:hypothetical protein
MHYLVLPLASFAALVLIGAAFLWADHPMVGAILLVTATLGLAFDVVKAWWARRRA